MTHYTPELLHALLRQRLSVFTQKAFATVSPADTLHWNWHLDVIADHLEQCVAGKIKRLIITVPPRSLKSITASVALPAWVLGHNPNRRIICASYSADLAGKFARDCRSVIESDWYRQAFPHTRLQRHAELDLVTTQQGGRYTTSVGGTLTGRGGSLIIIDDPMKPQDAMSESVRNSVKQWYDGTLYSRLDNKQDDVIIVVMQRLHLDDLVAHIIEKENWAHVDLPAIAEVSQSFTLSNGSLITRRQGEVLHPEREPEIVLDNIRATIGNMAFSAQYQQRPVPLEGNLIRSSWFQRYAEEPPMHRIGKIIQSWDTAATTSDLSDYSVCTTWLVKGDYFYLIDVFRKKLEYPDLIRTIIQQGKKYGARRILIENTSSGVALLQQLRRERTGLNFFSVKPDKDKITRLKNASVEIEAGRVFLPEKAPWLDDFLTEMLAFPGGVHDDQVDSTSQFLNYYPNRPKVKVVPLEGF